MTKLRLPVLFVLLLLMVTPVFAQEDADLSTVNSASVKLKGDSIEAEGYGMIVEGATVTITMPGVYSISGTLDNGQIIVDCDVDEKVILNLDGVEIRCEYSAPIYVRKSEKRTTIRTAANTKNVVHFGMLDEEEIMRLDDEDISGAIYSKDDLTITGEGTLEVVAENVDGIVSKDDLRIKGGVLIVTTPEDGIRGKDGVEIYDGQITVVAGRDGIKSTNKNDSARGYIQIMGGQMHITYGDELLQAATNIEITGGKLLSTYRED